ncbi:hypothetical protein XACLG97_11180001 [Xanthomonas citri pv. citri]|nr:hypothetical protein XACLG97_11180001 [Xanthomonas citri pv. citri]
MGQFYIGANNAIDCKNELVIEQALKRVANSPYSQALAKQGHEFLDAQAMQEAQEQGVRARH